MAALQSLRDEPGTLREYETIYILKPDSESSQIHAVNERLRGIIEDAQGKLLVVENWGKRKLAYEIQKAHKGIYLYWRYLVQPSLVSEIERNLRLLDTVMRFITVKVDENVDPHARPSDVTPETFVEVAATRPDEEDLYLGRRAGEDEVDEETGEADETGQAGQDDRDKRDEQRDDRDDRDDEARQSETGDKGDEGDQGDGVENEGREENKNA